MGFVGVCEASCGERGSGDELRVITEDTGRGAMEAGVVDRCEEMPSETDKNWR